MFILIDSFGSTIFVDFQHSNLAKHVHFVVLFETRAQSSLKHFNFHHKRVSLELLIVIYDKDFRRHIVCPALLFIVIAAFDAEMHCEEKECVKKRNEWKG